MKKQVAMAWQNLERVLPHVPDDQICGIWPDGSSVRGTHLKYLIAELKAALAKVSD